MAETLRDILESKGIDVGEIRSPVDERIDKIGTPISKREIWRARVGERDQRILARRVMAVDVLNEDGGSSEKDIFFLRAARIGVSLRTVQIRDGIEHRYSSDGFTEDLAENLNTSTGVMRSLVSGFRAECVMQEEVLGLSEEVKKTGIKAINNYFTDYADPEYSSPSALNNPVKKLSESWDGTITGFYRNFYRLLGGRSIGTFLPYELPFIETYFRSKIALGSQLSTFDFFVLKTRSMGRAHDELIEQVRDYTGVPINRHVILFHFKLLLGKIGIPGLS